MSDEINVMDIFCSSGTKVQFLDKNGHDYERDQARKFMEKGDTLIVEHVEIEPFSSHVYFKGVEGCFNSVMFGKLK